MSSAEAVLPLNFAVAAARAISASTSGPTSARVFSPSARSGAAKIASVLIGAPDAPAPAFSGDSESSATN
ncbi:hypothetical protein [Methylocella sp.]|uniref:hypothetical protein n=1 Tax=Methylocella sp. TaxID=1978226 RepID=UPI003783989B